MTLNNPEGPLSTILSYKCVYEAYHVNLNEDRPTPSEKNVARKSIAFSRIGLGG